MSKLPTNVVPLRHSTLRPNRLGFGDFVLDRAARTLMRGIEPRHLPQRVFDLLDALLARAGEVVTKQELLDKVWSGRPLTDSALTQAVAELRRALDEAGDGGRWIVTVHRVGYRFEGDVVPEPSDAFPAESALPRAEPMAVGSMPPGPLVTDTPPTTALQGSELPGVGLPGVAPAIASRNRARRIAGVFALVSLPILALLGVLAWVTWRGQDGAVAVTRLGLAPIRMPLAADAMAADAAIWERLRRMQGIEVVRLAIDPAAAEVARYAALAAQLQLEEMLTLALQNPDVNQNEVVLEFRGRDGRVLDRRVAAVTPAPDAMAKAIEAQVAARFGVTLPPRAPAEVRGAARESEQRRLTGEAQLEQRQRRAAIVSFEQALALDSQNAAAHAGLAVALAATAGQTLPLDEAHARARRHARTALDLAPDNASAYAALGLIAMQDGAAGADEALTHIDRALALDPAYSDAWMWRSQIHHPAISLATRIHDLERARAIDPAHLTLLGNLALLYVHAGRGDEAQALLARASESANADQALGFVRSMVASAHGRSDESMALQLRLYPDAGRAGVRRARLGTLIALDETALARRVLADLADEHLGDSLATLSLMPVLAELGEGERMIAMMARLPAADAARVLSGGVSLQEWRGVAAALAQDWPAAIAGLAPGIDVPNGLSPRQGDIGATLELSSWLLLARLRAGEIELAAALKARIDEFIRVQRGGGYGDSAALLYAEARLAALAQDRERAFALLERALDAGARRAENLRRDPRFHALRAYPRFAPLLQRATDLATQARARLAAMPEGAAMQAWRDELLKERRDAAVP